MMNYIRRFKTYCSGRKIPSKYSQLFRKGIITCICICTRIIMLIRSPENAFGDLILYVRKEKGEVWGSTYYERRDCTIVESKGEHTVAELADVLEITEMAIRRHLSNLEKDGLIYSKMVRQHVGRPTYLYGLSEKEKIHSRKSISNLRLIC